MITIDEAGIELGQIRERLIEAYKNVDRHRSWRPSEKAMTKAKYAREEQALLLAMTILAEKKNELAS